MYLRCSALGSGSLALALAQPTPGVLEIDAAQEKTILSAACLPLHRPDGEAGVSAHVVQVSVERLDYLADCVVERVGLPAEDPVDLAYGRGDRLLLAIVRLGIAMYDGDDALPVKRGVIELLSAHPGFSESGLITKMNDGAASMAAWISRSQSADGGMPAQSTQILRSVPRAA